MARPIHPELAAYLRAGVSCFYFNFARGRRDSIDLSQEKKRLREAPEARDERRSEGECERGEAREVRHDLRVGSREPEKEPLGGLE